MIYSFFLHTDYNLHIGPSFPKLFIFIKRNPTWEGVLRLAGKVSYNKVKLAFEAKGYELITTEENYKNTTTKLKYKCPIHPDKELWITYHKLNSGGNGCK